MNRITTQDIRLSIDFYKGLKGQDWSLFNFGFMRNQSQIHQYINTNENRMYNRSELISIESYVYTRTAVALTKWAAAEIMCA